MRICYDLWTDIVTLMTVEKLQYDDLYCDFYDIWNITIYDQYCDFSEKIKSYNIPHDIVT